MKLSVYFSAIVWLLVMCVCVHAGERGESNTAAQVIRLDRIWAYEMPRTRDVRKINGPDSMKHIKEIRESLSSRPTDGKIARAGFAVEGTGTNNLRQAHSVLVEGNKLRDRFPANREISLIFFSYQFGRYVQLHKVVMRDNEIDIHYGFVPHKSKEVTEHFALIPLGAIGPGKRDVKIIQSPIERRLISAGWNDIAPKEANRIVCNSFSFVVE
jgi:hypothetical protein